MRNKVNICSVSGGKDSTALYLLMQEFHGNDFLPIFADTGHEHPVTVNYVKNLHHMANGPQVTIVRSDWRFPMQVRRKAYIKQLKELDGIAYDLLLTKARKMHPTGNTFLDMMIYKSAVPTSKMQFCTEHLKLWPIKFFLEKNYPDHEWIIHTGIRAGESTKRRDMQPFMWNDFFDCLSVLPMLNNSEDDEFELMELRKVPPNPLYAIGNSRVGCYPCIHANKDQISNLPEWVWDKLAWFESRLGLRWFQQGTVEYVKNWSQTSHGGKQFNMFRQSPEDAPSCMTGWMSCE